MYSWSNLYGKQRHISFCEVFFTSRTYLATSSGPRFDCKTACRRSTLTEDWYGLQYAARLALRPSALIASPAIAIDSPVKSPRCLCPLIRAP